MFGDDQDGRHSTNLLNNCSAEPLTNRNSPLIKIIGVFAWQCENNLACFAEGEKIRGLQISTLGNQRATNFNTW